MLESLTTSTNKQNLMSEPWHLSKNITISTLLSIIILLLTQVYTYGKNQEKLNNLTVQVQVASEKHVVKSDLDQRLSAQEYKIEVVSDDMREVKQTLKENQAMMIELLQRIPKTP